MSATDSMRAIGDAIADIFLQAEPFALNEYVRINRRGWRRRHFRYAFSTREEKLSRSMATYRARPEIQIKYRELGRQQALQENSAMRREDVREKMRATMATPEYRARCRIIRMSQATGQCAVCEMTIAISNATQHMVTQPDGTLRCRSTARCDERAAGLCFHCNARQPAHEMQPIEMAGAAPRNVSKNINGKPNQRKGPTVRSECIDEAACEARILARSAT